MMDAKQGVKKMTVDKQIEIAAPIKADETTANADGSSRNRVRATLHPNLR
jgi:hypothetical protein